MGALGSLAALPSLVTRGRGEHNVAWPGERIPLSRSSKLNPCQRKSQWNLARHPNEQLRVSVFSPGKAAQYLAKGPDVSSYIATMADKTLLAAASVLALFILLSKLKSLLVTKPKLNLPPGPWTLPVIGSLHHLVTSPTVYRAMRGLAQKHGPVMMLQLGEIPMLVVSSPEAAAEIMKTHDIIFADRYRNPTINALTFDGDVITFGAYGERWRQLRKICMLELLSPARVQSFRHIREEEVARFMENIAASAGAGAAVDLTKMISRFINDTIVSESLGSRSKYQDEYIDAIHTALHQTSGLAVADLFPSSRIMQVLDTTPRKVLACRNRMERILKQIIQEKTEAMDRSDGQAVAEHDGFLNVLLRLQKEGNTPIPVTNDIIMKLVFDMVGAGTDTSSTMLNWCMTELVRSPTVMAKAQAEVREALKGEGTITEDDLQRLSYLKLVMKETLRLRTPGPLLLPRVCRETCKVMGYDIPKGTVVLTNVWAICRDPKYWDDPEEFKPERFENSHRDYNGTCYEFLPFGAGRRICPGMNLGVANVELALARLLYHFDWKLPAGMKPENVDVTDVPGFVSRRKTSLILHPVTRIHPVSA